MRLFRRFDFRVAKGDSTGGLFRRARAVATDLSNGPPFVVFTCWDPSFEEPPGPSTKVSAVRRVVELFPELASLEHDPALGQERSSYDHVSLTNAETGGQPQVALDTLETVAEGVPASYPFLWAEFCFLGVDWFHDGTSVPEDVASALSWGWMGPAAHSIATNIFWGDSLRETEMEANIEINPPASDVGRLPELPADVWASLGRLGKVKLETLMALPSEEEKAFLAAVGPEAKRVVEATRAEMRDREIALRSPCQLPRDAPDSSALPRVPASPKKAMGDALKPLGYEYRSKLSGHGTYYLTKRSASNNLMHIHFDAGCFGLGGQFRYEGPLWQATVTLPLPPGVEYVGWRYLGQEVLDHACRKAAVAVEYLEKTFVPALDAIYGPAPAWFEYPH